MSATFRDLGRVLVTGAHGFLGAALVTRLRTTGHDVTASDRTTDSHACDLTEFAQVDAVVRGGSQTIFHCGAVSGPMVIADQPLEIWRINALGTPPMSWMPPVGIGPNGPWSAPPRKIYCPLSSRG